MVKEKRPEYAGQVLFQDFYRTRDISKLFEGHEEFMAVNKTGFIGRLRSCSGAHYLGNEFPGVEYEVKLSVRERPNKVALSSYALAESVARTFTGMKRYLADGVVHGAFTDVLYFGAEKEIGLIELGPPRRIKQKVDLKFIVNSPQTALVAKRREVMNNAQCGEEDLVHMATYAARLGGSCPGRAEKGNTGIDVLDTYTGRVYNVTASETTVRSLNVAPLFQVEVEYKGFISAFANKRPFYPRDKERTAYENEDQIVAGIVHLGSHVRRKIAWDKVRDFKLEPTNLTKYQFVRNAYGKRTAQSQAIFEERFGLADAVTK